MFLVKNVFDTGYNHNGRHIIACNLVYGINTDEDRVVISYIPGLKWAIVSFTSYSAPNDETEGYMDDLKAAFNVQ